MYFVRLSKHFLPNYSWSQLFLIQSAFNCSLFFKLLNSSEKIQIEMDLNSNFMSKITKQYPYLFAFATEKIRLFLFCFSDILSVSWLRELYVAREYLAGSFSNVGALHKLQSTVL